MLSHTARARPVLRCSPLLSRQNLREGKWLQISATNMATNMAAPMCSLLRTVYTSPKAITARGAKGPFQDRRALCILPVTRYAELDVLNTASGIDPP